MHVHNLHPTSIQTLQPKLRKHHSKSCIFCGVLKPSQENPKNENRGSCRFHMISWPNSLGTFTRSLSSHYQQKGTPTGRTASFSRSQTTYNASTRIWSLYWTQTSSQILTGEFTVLKTLLFYQSLSPNRMHPNFGWNWHGRNRCRFRISTKPAKRPFGQMFLWISWQRRNSCFAASVSEMVIFNFFCHSRGLACDLMAEYPPYKFQ